LPRGAVVSERFELARNFCNKLWNVARLALLNLDGYTAQAVTEAELAFEDRWILSRLATVTGQVTAALDEYHFADAARVLYDFAWDEFCSSYAEMVKRRLDDPASRAAAQRVLAHVLDQLLRLLHPLIPFLTEEVWQLLDQVAPRRGLGQPASAAESIVIAPWPAADAARRDEVLESRFACYQSVLGALREIRSRQNIAPRQSIEFHVCCDEATVQLLRPMQPYFLAMANATGVAWGGSVVPPATHAHIRLPSCEVYVDLKDFLDVPAEIARNEKQRDRLLAMIQGKQQRLESEAFVSRAPAAVVQRERENLDQLRQQLASVEQALDKLR
jgi:valyl-tRNA synthetase